MTVQLAIQADPLSSFAEAPQDYWYDAIAHVPSVVIGAWLALALAGRWSPERSWVDRAGRSIGFFWITALTWEIVGPALSKLWPVL